MSAIHLLRRVLGPDPAPPVPTRSPGVELPGEHELHMISHDWMDFSAKRPRVFLECGTCGAMFLTAFRVKFCRVCWQERHAHA